LVTLNSGSKLRYPVAFIDNNPRTVYLEGEGFFSIEKNKNSHFTVVTDDLNTRVYGTEFNVSSYPEDINTTTILVEGSVSVYKSSNYNREKPIMINPGQRATMENELIVIDEVDVMLDLGFRFQLMNIFDIIPERRQNVLFSATMTDDVDKLISGQVAAEKLEYVFEAIRLTKDLLQDRVPLIGFSGAPWTLLAYMVEGSGSKTFSKAKRLLYKEPKLAHQLLDAITDTIVAYLKLKVKNGVDTIQLFDSWAGCFL
jgi:hypothetical protein